MSCISASTIPKALNRPLLALQPTQDMHHQLNHPPVMRHALHYKDACRRNTASRTPHVSSGGAQAAGMRSEGS